MGAARHTRHPPPGCGKHRGMRRTGALGCMRVGGVRLRGGAARRGDLIFCHPRAPDNEMSKRGPRPVEQRRAGDARLDLMKGVYLAVVAAVLVAGTVPCVADGGPVPSPPPSPPGLTNCSEVNNATLADLAHCMPKLAKGDGHATDRGRSVFMTIVGICLALGIALLAYNRYFVGFLTAEDLEGGNYSRARGDNFDEDEVEQRRRSGRSRGDDGIAMSRMTVDDAI